MTDAKETGSARVRLDVWLDVACLFPTRSAAQKACQTGRLEVNGERAKPHREVKAGDAIEVRRPLGRRQRVVVRAVASRHVPKAEARLLYEDVTPPPTPEEIEDRRLAAWSRPRLPGRAPDKRERRALRRMKEADPREDGPEPAPRDRRRDGA
jgi:ribosome-associated heat shock protein Hsp15